MSFQITSFLRTKVDTQKKNLTHPHAKKKEYVLRYPNYHRRSIRSLEHHHQERRHPSVRARTALLFLVVGIYFSPLSFSLSIYIWSTSRAFCCFTNYVIPRHVKMWKCEFAKKKTRRARFFWKSSLIRERRKEMRPKHSSRSRFLREKKFLERGKAFLERKRACLISLFFFL